MEKYILKQITLSKGVNIMKFCPECGVLLKNIYHFEKNKMEVYTKCPRCNKLTKGIFIWRNLTNESKNQMA